MKNKNVKIISMLFAFVFGALLFVACGQTRGNITFTDLQVQMAYNQEINIADLVSLENCNITDIVFVSSNPEIVLVTPRQTIIAGSQDGVAILTAEGYNGFLEIQVLGTNLNFTPPTNVHFDEATGFVMWDSVYVGNVVANTYTVKITKDGTPLDEQVVNTTSLEIVGEGVFEVEVSCNAKSGVQPSVFSEKYTFTKLPSPTELEYNVNTGILSWSAPEGVTHFYVKKDGVLSEKIDKQYFVLNLANTQTYELSVLSATNNSEKNVFGSSSEVLSLTRLAAPQVSLANGNVTWNDTQEGVSSYSVSIATVIGGVENIISTDSVVHNGTTYSYSLPSLEAGEYVVKVGAIGSGNENGIYTAGVHFLNSALAQTEKTTKLAPKDLLFDKLSNTISVKDFDANAGLQLSLIAQKQGEDAENIDISSGSVTYDFDSAGNYTFHLLNVSKSNMEITSEAGSSITVIKLGQMTNLRQTETSAGEYVLTGMELDNATNFEVSVVYEGDKSKNLSLNNSNYGLTSTIFDKAGNYEVKVTASGEDSANKYVISSVTTVKVVRLTTNAIQKNGEQIVWQAAGDLANIVYSYSYTGAAEQIGTIQSTVFDLSVLTVGAYTFTLKAVGLNKTETETLILDSFTSESITFEIRRPLSKVDLSFERSATGYNLLITPVANATTYTITVNKQPFKVEDYSGTEELVIAVESCFASAGVGADMLSYNFEVYATNKDNSFHEQSPANTITVKKEYAPTAFSLLAGEVVATDKPYSHIAEDEILINDVVARTLDPNVQNFNVKVKYIAKVQNYEGVYYIDSDYAEFELNRVQVELKIRGMKAYWTSTETNQIHTPYLMFEQGEKSFALNLTYTPVVDLEFFNFEEYGLTLDMALSGHVECVFGKFDGEIVGSYQNGKFVSGNSGKLTQYYIGGKSSATIMQIANASIGIDIEEQNNEITVSWNKTDGAEYALFDGGDEISSSTNSVTVPSVKLQQTGKHNLSLSEYKDGVTNVYMFFVNRLEALNKLTILEDESLQADLIPGSSAIEITKEGVAILSLKDVTEDTTVVAFKYVAQDNITAFEFFLDSQEVQYSFARLSALNTISNLNIYDNVISWSKEGSADISKYSYNVKFFDEHGTEKIVSLEAGVSNSIDLASDEYQEILAGLSGIKYISIEKFVGEFVAEAEVVNYLTSQYSKQVALKIIEAPTNVKIELTADPSGDNAIVQNSLTISWTINDAGVEIAGYTVEITHNEKSTEYESGSAFVATPESGLFALEGVWSVRVRALGANDSILSEYSESVSITRLKATESLAMSKSGIVAWSKVTDAIKYMVAYSYTNTHNSWLLENSLLSTESFVEELQNEFAGNVDITLYALGDGTTTLTSIKTASYTRLEKPSITYENDRIIVDNYKNYPEGTNLFVTAKIGTQTVLSKEIALVLDSNSKYVWYYPTEFSYIDSQTGETVVVDSSTQQQIDFVFEACNRGALYLNSNKVSQTLFVLSPLTDLRMVRGVDGVIHLLATNKNSSVTTARVKIGDRVWLFDGNVDLELSDSILKDIPTSWSISVQSTGVNNGTNIYINSKFAYITGTRLGAVENIFTKDGAVTWSQVTGAYDYKMLIDNNTALSGYTTTRSEKLAGADFTSGDHILCIRAVGNIGTTPVSKNIVLDGDYSADYTVTKLDALSDLTVENGFLTFTAIQNASAYVVEAYTSLDSAPIGEYELSQYDIYPDQKNTNGYYYSAILLEKLDELTAQKGSLATLYIKVYNKTTQDNYVYSDYAQMVYGSGSYDYITVGRIQNSSQRVDLYHPTKPDGDNLDYTTTIAKWTQNALTANKYLLNVDGALSLSETNSYVLDQNGTWTPGSHLISYAQIGSTGLTTAGLAYLTAAFSETVELTKLNDASPYLAILEGLSRELCISYATVTGADKYYSYLDGEYFGEYNNAGIAIMMDGMVEGYEYNNFALRAVNTSENITYIASNVCYLKVFDDVDQKEKIIGVSKTRSPKLATFDDGEFYWEFTDEEWLQMLEKQDRIFNTNKLSLAFNQFFTSKFVVKFTSCTAPVYSYSYVDNISNYIYVSDEQFVTICGYIDTLAPTLGFTEEQVYVLKRDIRQYLNGGFASANHNFSTFATSLPSGEYVIEVKTIGSGTVVDLETREFDAWFSSSFVNLGKKYIASAPGVNAVALDGKYSLKFTNVNVNSTYFKGGISYKLFGTYYDEEYDVNRAELITTLKYSTLNNSAQIAFDLTGLIEEGLLESKYINLFVTVAGNDANVLNGKTSNIINIQILSEITSKIERGIILWSAQEFASKYQIAYLKAGESETKFLDIAVEEEKEWYNWIAGELEEDTSYTVSLQACGLTNGVVNNNETFIMSGKVTPIGTVNKLAGISNLENGIDIKNGMFVWNEIENATSYDVYRLSPSSGTIYVETVGKNSFYETTVTNLESYYYYFMSIGTEFEDLTETSNTYVNSNLSGRNYAQRLGAIRSVSYDNAVISFTPVYKTGYYKLTFYKINKFGENSEGIVVYTTETNFDTNSHEGLLSPGKYDVEIQAIYKDKTLVETTTNCYYVISPKNLSSFYKFDKVYNIKVGEYDIPSADTTIHYDGGVISWAHDNTENMEASLYEYKLTFKAYTEDGVYIGEEIKTVPSSQKYFEGVVFDKIDPTDKITLEIYVNPTETAIESSKNYVYSDIVTYGVYSAEQLVEPIYLHQYMQIDETKLAIGITEKSQLKIDWTRGISGSNTGDFTYEVSFSIAGVEYEPLTTNDTFLIIGNEDEGLFADDSATTVILKIRVIPTSENFISSAWTNSKEITRPQSIEGLAYDDTTHTVIWDAYNATSNWDSYKYKIRDEVTYVDLSGDTYVDVYIVIASLGDEQYTPFAIGTHKISVAVMVTSADQENSDFISAYKTIEDIEFNLYESGAGTEESPYVILNPTQFANMQYRMSKDAKNNKYFLTRTVNGETIIDNQETTDSITNYYFKQEGHITLVKNGDVDETLYNNETAFDNIYDGDRYSLTLAYTHIDDTTDYEHVSIFRTLGENAIIRNIKLLFEFSATDNSLKGSGDWADISVLAEQNNGTIENIAIGSAGATIRINTVYLIFSLSMLTGSNYGTITNVQNNYNVVIEDKNINVQQQINFAPIAINNYGTILYAKNNGNISVSASNLLVGGLVVVNSGANAKITGGANKGSFDIYYKSVDVSYVGGLVARNTDNASLAYCYNIGDIEVSGASGVLPSEAYVGGLIGWATHDAITYSYVNASFTTSIVNFNTYQLIGMLQGTQSSASHLYYNGNIGVTAIRGTTGSGVSAFSTSPLDCDLYGSGTLFNRSDTDGGNPRLDWEAKLFGTIEWREILG